MTLNRKLSPGDVYRLLAELRAQLPPDYDPYDDYWAAPYDCDPAICALDDEDRPEEILRAVFIPYPERGAPPWRRVAG
ncbi:hypothetical protein [Gordonia alkaliphila]|uniref:Uncharacterized protein n=1 Tax=Gordonia alkaliphila TaxID=1053547 RepID=A0ABP8ZEU9_9ACTN